MAARSSMSQIIRELRRKVNDVGPAELDDDQYYAGDSVKFTYIYRDLDGAPTDPTVPKVTIWDPEGTKRVDGETPAPTGVTGEYEYIYRIPDTGPERVWRVEFAGTVNGHINEHSEEFEVFITRRIWTDDELQEYLDMHRVHVLREPLMKDADGRTYYSRFGMLEDDVTLWDGDSADSVAVPSSNYTTNLVDGTFTFTESQDGTYYLDGKSYNLHGAIAECLEQLAMDPNKAVRWSRGGVQYEHYNLMELAKYHRNLAGPRGTLIRRTYPRVARGLK